MYKTNSRKTAGVDARRASRSTLWSIQGIWRTCTSLFLAVHDASGARGACRGVRGPSFLLGTHGVIPPYIHISSDNWEHAFMVRICNGLTMHDFGTRPPDSVLDLGCGAGLWVMEAAEAWPVSKKKKKPSLPGGVLSIGHASTVLTPSRSSSDSGCQTRRSRHERHPTRFGIPRYGSQIKECMQKG
jgi:hypothetical protein